MKHRGVLAALALCLMLALLPGNARAAETDSKWGGIVTWSYNESTKTLTVSGAGPMPDGPPPCDDLYAVQALVIDSGVTTISAKSFEYCSNLKEVTIPASVVSIGDEAFQSCGKLAQVTIPGDGVSIGDSAFDYCQALTSAVFSGSVDSIGDNAFNYCKSLSSLIFENDVGSIGQNAFYSCDALTDIVFQGKVGPIGQAAFSYCRELNDIAFSNDVESIGSEAFSCCSKLTDVAINGSVGRIGESAFYGCDALTSVMISGNAASIGNNAFEGLENLTKFHVGGTLGSIGTYAFYDCTGLTEFPAVDGGMTGPIAIYAFAGCTGFHRIMLPEGVTIIGAASLYSCSNLTAVWIPDSVTRIVDGAFDSWTLKDIYYGGTEEQWKSVEGYDDVQNDGLPVIHYGCKREFPETAAGDNETLRRLVQNGIGAGLTEIELTGDIDLGSATLPIQDRCNLVLDLKGHRITSSADPAITVVGSLTVKDSTEKSSPAVGQDNRVSYACDGIISSTGLSREVIDVQFGGSFTLLGGTVSGNSSDIAIRVTGAPSEDSNPDGMETTVDIDGGYVEAGGPAISVSGVSGYVRANGGVMLSRGAAVILSPETSAENNTRISVSGGTLINKRTGQLSCGIYQPQNGSVSIYSGRIIVENGIGVLVRGEGRLSVWWYRSQKLPPEITAGGSGTGIIGSSDLELSAGKKIVLDHKSGYPQSDRMSYELSTSLNSLALEFQAEALAADGYELKREDRFTDRIRYTFGPIVTYQITFDSNGGTAVTPGTMETDTSGRIAQLPAEPVREGYVFRGWSTEKDDLAYRVGTGSQLRRDTTLYALWTPNGAHIISVYYCNDSGVEYFIGYRVTGTDGVLSDWPSRDTIHGPIVGWFTNPAGGEEYSEDHVFTGDTNVYGHRTPDTPPPYDIAFDPNGGSGSAVTITTDEKGRLDSWPAEPTRDGYVFMGWGRWPSGSYLVGQKETFFRSETLYAQWMQEGGYVIRFSLNEDDSDTVSETRNTNLQGRLDRWPDTPLRAGTDYIFSGWYTSSSGGSRLNFDHRFYGDTRLYAHWIQRSSAGAGYCVITFDANGGTGSSVLMTEQNGRLAFLPYNDPVLAGYTFAGWFTGKSDGSEVTTATVFTADTTVYAHWTANGDTPGPDDPGKFTVTFDPNGGTGGGSMTTGEDGKLAALPGNPTREGYVFAGWFTGKSDGSEVTTATVFAADTTVYAHWTANGDTPGPDDPGKFTVTFDPNGGTGGGSMTTGEDGKLAALPGNPTREGYVFAGWFTGKSDGSEVTTATVFAADTTVYAHWTANGETPGPDDPGKFTVIFDANGGTGGGSMTTGTDGKLTALPGNPTREGYVFAGWFTGKSDGGEVTAATVFTANITVYAHWTANGDTPGPDDPGKFTVTFDPNGGAGGGSMTTGTDGKLAALPANPVRGGYVFDGWYTARLGGTRIGTGTVFTENTTVYAHWNREADAGIYYRIYTPYRAPGGSFYVSHATAAAGTRVTIELSPWSGYELDWLLVTDLVTGQDMRLTWHNSNEYSFIMPAGDVEVGITFAVRYTGGFNGTDGSYSVPNSVPTSTKPIRWYYSNGAIYHVTDGLVPADALLTRDMLISILYNLDSASTGKPESWAIDHSIVPDVYESLLWGVDKPVSREQAVVILFSYAQYKNYSTFERADLTGYADYGLIRPIARPAMSWARAAGLIAGTSAGTLSPRNNLTCGQASIILSRFTGK